MLNFRDPTIYATILSLAGALLVTSMESSMRLTGFSAWVISNVIWVAYFVRTKQWNPAMLFTVYFVTSCMGVVNNLK